MKKLVYTITKTYLMSDDKYKELLNQLKSDVDSFDELSEDDWILAHEEDCIEDFYSNNFKEIKYNYLDGADVMNY